MLLEIEIELSKGIEQDLNRSLEEVTAEIVRTIAEDAPGEMALMMPEGGGKSSAKGNPPNRQSGQLARELKGRVVSPSEAKIDMPEHAFYLDPLFDGQGKGGGYLNRPFIEEGIVRSLKKNL